MRRISFLPIIIIILYAATIPANVCFKSMPIARQHSADIIQNIFGTMRDFVADWAFMKAEEYHHRGLPFMKAMAYHADESLSEEEGHHEHEESAAARAQDLFTKIYSSVKITGDSHLKSAEEKEALPWFFIEVEFNPNDIRGYVLGAYWLQRMGRLDESLKFLEAGQKNNPDSAAIKAALGHVYYKKGDIGPAVNYLEKARELWHGKLPVNAVSDRYAITDKYFALDLLGSIYENSGKYDAAVEIYNELYKFQPNEALGEKIKRFKVEHDITAAGAGKPEDKR